MATGRVGVLGGTFDPIHYAHLRLAEEALDRFQLDRVLLIPAGNPPHKAGEVMTAAEDRLAMALLATATHPCFEVSSIELERTGYSYTVDTLAELQRRSGATTRLYFIIGVDAVLEMHTWKAPEQVLELCELVVAARPGFDANRLAQIPVRGLMERIRLMGGASSDISSTDIRQRIREGRTIRYLTPEPVESYIRKRGLYRKDGVGTGTPDQGSH